MATFIPPAKLEDAMARLEAVLSQIEAGVSLDEMLVLFEEGCALATHVADVLAHTPNRIEILTREHGQLVAKPWSVPE